MANLSDCLSPWSLLALSSIEARPEEREGVEELVAIPIHCFLEACI